MLENVLYYLNIIFQDFAYLYLSLIIVGLTDNEKINKKNIIFNFITIIVFSIISINTKFPINTIAFITIFILSFYFIFRFSITKSIFLSTISVIIAYLVELICVYTAMLVIRENFILIQSNEYLKILLNFIYSVSLLIVTYIIYRIGNKRESIKVFFKEVKIHHIKTFLIITLICIFPQIIIFMVNIYNYPASFLIINSVQMIALSLFAFIYLKKAIENEKTKEDLAISEIHNKTLIGMIDGVRILKHDYNNIIQALSGYISTKQYDKLEKHISSVMKECKELNTLSAITSEIFNDPGIYGIVGSKYFIAVEKNITFETDVTINISALDFPMQELSRILGILLDNAIEATSKIENKFMRLEMFYDIRKNADIIRVINTYDTNISIDFEQIYKKGFSTKEIKSGIGLWEVRKLIDKFKNSQIYPSIEKDKFVQTIIIEK